VRGGETVTAGATRVRFGYQIDAYTSYDATLKGLIESNNCRSICEVGGGANPALPLEYVTARRLKYYLLDIAPGELAKAPPGYEKIVADISGETVPTGGPFDLVFSKMLAEHVRDARRFHRNVYELLRPGGVAFHFFPTLYALPLLANRLLPERLSAFAQRLFSPRDPVRDAKFPAYYRWCRGPTKAQIRRFENLGYLVEEYDGYFGHGYYDRVPFVRSLHRLLVAALVRFPVPWFTSVAYLILRRKNVEMTA
jgi:SAM-dependent methyltransferase